MKNQIDDDVCWKSTERPEGRSIAVKPNDNPTNKNKLFPGVYIKSRGITDAPDPLAQSDVAHHDIISQHKGLEPGFNFLRHMIFG
jgi:hypothetical protein